MLTANAAVTVSERRLLFSKRLILSTVLFVLLLAASISWWESRSQSSLGNCVFRVPSSMVANRSFGNYSSRGDCLRLGRAASPKELQQGLSGRQIMPGNEGLLFDFNGSGERCMWMKDMRFSLDMIWLDNSRTINHIETNLSPETYPQPYCGNGNAAYVIEVNSGIAKAANLKIGDRLSF